MGLTGPWCLRVAAAAGACLALLAVPSAQTTQREYVDVQRGFRFSYPSAFGETSPGTNDGFGDRAAAVRFSVFSTAAIGGEAALTRGFPFVDIQAVGGLYDSIALEVFPDPIRAAIIKLLPRLTTSNFCQLLAQERRLDPDQPAFSSLTPAQRAAIAGIDRTRSVNPRVLRCDVQGATVTFDKEASFQEGTPRQRVYGAVRFLQAPYSTFQIVRAGQPPDAALLDQMEAVVQSWAPLP